MITTRLWRTLLVITLAGLVLPNGVGASAAPTPDDDAGVAGKIDGSVLDEVAEEGSADFWVVLGSEADLSAARKHEEGTEKARSVRAAKTRHAADAQAGMRALLEVEGVEYEAFWISNAILVTDGDAELLEKIATRPEVESIEPDEPIVLPEPEEGTVEEQVDGVEWGVDRINAPQVWDEFGVRGEDIVVANIDTGAQFDHPALVNQYRGNSGDGSFTHDYNWFDPAAVCSDAEPCDNNGHGTHVMGTMVGDDGEGNQVGVAPGATWIAAKGCETNNCSTASLLAAGQWLLAPTDANGENPRPDLAPDVVNNSWGGGGGDFWYQDVVDAWVAAGIFPSFANGNAGSACATAGSPGDYQNSYASGAFDINNQTASFSSRGAGPDGEIKPNIAAPGVNIRSTWPGDGYNAISGTSMATPHTSGAVALMWSASPALRGDVAATREILDQTAVDTADDQCGGTAADNNVWGEGRLNAYTAVEQSPRGDLGAAAGRISLDDGSPVAGATVTFDGPLRRVRTTGDDGAYTLDRLIAGDYTVTVEKYGHQTVTDTVTVATGQTTTADFTLQEAPSGTLHGVITDGSGHDWPLHAKITIDGYPHGPIYTDPYTGDYSVDLPQNTYTLHIQSLYPGYQTTHTTITVDTTNTEQNLQIAVHPANCDAPGYAHQDSGECVATPGGLVAGVATTAATGGQVDDVTVVSDANNDEYGTTAATSDPKVPSGFYFLFSSSAGAIRFTASHFAHQTASAVVDVVADGVTRQDWALKAGRLAVTPESISTTATLGESRTREVTFTNNGDAPMHVQLGKQDGGTRQAVDAGQAIGGSTGRLESEAKLNLDGEESQSEWVKIADYPFGIWDHAMATEPLSGKVYSVGGVMESVNGFEPTRKGFVYDPEDDVWTPITDAPEALQGSHAAFINGTLYLIGGARANGANSRSVYAYNPGADSWTEASSLPAPVSFAGSAVLDGKLYIVGGCAAVPCRGRQQKLDTVYRFDPIQDTWTQLADYPTLAGEPACAGTTSKLICAGGTGDGPPLDDTYVFDPVTNSWSQGVDMPSHRESMANTGSGGELQIIGGYSKELSYTDEGWHYNPIRNTWSALPASTYRTYGSSGSCGFYHVGGYTDSLIFGRTGKKDAELLSGYDQCDGADDMSWLTMSESVFDLNPGESFTVTLTMDSSELVQPGSYSATLYARTNSPYPIRLIDLTMDATPPASWSLVEGTVTDTRGHAIDGATIAASRVNADHEAFVVRTNAAGRYQWWIDAGHRSAHSQLEISVAKDGYQPELEMVTLKQGKTLNSDFLVEDDPENAIYRPVTYRSEKNASGSSGLMSDDGVGGDAVGTADVSFAGVSVRKVSPLVRDEVAKDGEADFWVVLGREADLSGSKKHGDGADRARSARAAKTRHAAESQAGLRALLELEKVEYEAFWITNAILVTNGDAELLDKVAARPEVESVEPDEPIVLPEPEGGTVEEQVNGVEWGVDRINALRVWDEFGVRGEDVVVANIDTGVQFDHPALVGQYRGNNGDGTFDHNYNWFDPAEVCPSDDPCDNHGHGTHTMGTMVGDDGAGNQVGVAPGAKWIAAKGCEGNNCSQASLLAAGQWVIAPTDLNGNNPRPDLAPDVVNNSWGGGGGDFWYQDVVNAWVAAGIFPSFANGNNGPNCGTAGSPGDNQISYSSGAFDIDNQIANFSSRGPGPDGEIKPNIAAPGVNIRSSVPGDGYGSASGTSMATPHTTGTVALMWSMSPALRGDVAATREILDLTAIDTADDQCGGTEADNNAWGEGRLDALAAVEQSPRGDLGAVSGHVTSEGSPVAGATVTFDGPLHRVRTTADDGAYSIARLIAGDYTATVEKYGYRTVTDTVTVATDQTATADFALNKSPAGTLHGVVTDGSGHGWPLHAKITIDGYPHGPIYTDPYTGDYSVDLPQNTYTLHIQSLYPGYQTTHTTITVDTTNTEQNVQIGVNGAPCNARGYIQKGIYEGFSRPDFATTPPEGWTVEGLWEFAGGQPDQENFAGGAGGYAVTYALEPGSRESGTLTSPLIDLTFADSPYVAFDTAYGNAGGSDNTDTISEVDLSLDGGQTWQNTWHKESAGERKEHVQIPVVEAAGQADVQVRFHFSTGVYLSYWAVDGVAVGEGLCEPTPGGLVVGNVSDAITGDPVDGATVSSTAKPEEAGTSANTGDPNLSGGFYSLFSSHIGETAFDARARAYQTTSADVDVVADGVTRQDWALKTGRLAVTPESISTTATLGESRTRKVTFTNNGTAPIRIELGKQLGVFTPTSTPVSQTALTSSPTVGSDTPTAAGMVTPPTGPSNSSKWLEIPPYPIPISWSAVAYDARTGNVYSVGGHTPDTSGTVPFGTATAKGYTWNSTNGKWIPIADAPQPLEQSVAAFVNGVMYVAGGWDADESRLSTVYAYHPAADRWTRVAELPQPLVSSAGAVLDGKLYLVGGCADVCWDPTDAVYRYDPIEDDWTTVASYPTTVARQACAGIDGKLVCAGGYGAGGVGAGGRHSSGPMDDTYIYDPASDKWSRGADIPYQFADIPYQPVGRTGMGYSAANGRLQIIGAVRSAEYSLATDRWSLLPPLPVPLVDVGSGCGLYIVGGRPLGGGDHVDKAWRLPGFEHCGGSGEPAWLSVDKTVLNLAPDESATVTVKLDSAKVAQPGTYTAMLWARSDSAHPIRPVEVAMHVDPPQGWILLRGNVADSYGQPMLGASVHVNTRCRSIDHCSKAAYTVKTNHDGYYQWWLSKGHSPLRVIASRDTYVQQVRRTTVNGGTTTLDFSLPDFMPPSSPPPTSISFDDLRERVEAFEADGDVTEAGANRLGVTVDRAERHHDRGANSRAIAVLEEFKEIANDSRYVPSEIARDALIADAERLIEQLGERLSAPGRDGVGAGTQFVPV